MLPRSAFQEKGLADTPHTNAPVTPPASAARSSAPTLPGSCTSIAARMNASPVRADLRRRYAFPTGDGDDARRALHRAERIEHGIGRLDDIDALALEPLRQQSFFGLRGQLRRRDGNRLELQTGRARVVHQVGAVQQQASAGRVWFVSQRSERGDDGVLPARDDLHPPTIVSPETEA